MNAGNKISIYCSEPFGLNEKLVSVIRSWLQQRQGFVVVNGEKSAPVRLADMVFQSTALGLLYGTCTPATVYVQLLAAAS